MRNLSPHRRFVSPGNLEGIPEVFKHRAPPRREVPLAGTKTMLTPQDSSLSERVGPRPIESSKPCRTATIFGYLAMGLAVALPLVVIFYAVTGLPDLGSSGGAAFFVSLVLVHLFAIFSQIQSSGKNLVGGLAIPVFYGSLILAAIIDHLLG